MICVMGIETVDETQYILGYMRHCILDKHLMFGREIVQKNFEIDLWTINTHSI
jgi:hypothetical protein